MITLKSFMYWDSEHSAPRNWSKVCRMGAPAHRCVVKLPNDGQPGGTLG